MKNFKNSLIGGVTTLAFSALLAGNVVAQSNCIAVDSIKKISDTQGSFSGGLANNDYFGQSVQAIGDINNDGVTDIAVGAHQEDYAGTNIGGVWVLLMNNDGTVNSEKLIAPGLNGFTGTLSTLTNGAFFGRTVASIGDLNNDGVPDMAVGADEDNTSGPGEGSFFVLFMKNDGTVDSYTKIGEGEGGFGGTILNGENFGRAIANVGDIDDDGVEDLAVGANHAAGGGTERGSVWIILMDTNGTVKSEQEITHNTGGLGTLANNDRFGSSIAAAGDLNNDGVEDIAVVANENGGEGYIKILYMKTDGTVDSETDISSSTGGFGGTINAGSNFVNSIANIGDLDYNGSDELLIGSWIDDDGGTNRGASWVLYMNSSGTVIDEFKLSSTTSGTTPALANDDRFGSSVSSMGDFNQDGTLDFIVGARNDDNGGTNRGAIYLVFTKDTCCTATCFEVSSEEKISDVTGSLGGILSDGDAFGMSVSAIGDINQDGTPDIIVGANGDDGVGGSNIGAAYIVMLTSSGGVSSVQKISETDGNFSGALNNGDLFGRATTGIGDLDKDGVVDVVVGADEDDDGGSGRGAFWVLFMNDDGTVKSETKVSDITGSFDGTLDDGDNFARSLASIGDIDGDGVVDLAVGANHDDDGGASAGAVWIVFMNDDGTVKDEQKISNLSGDLVATIPSSTRFGTSVASVGDLNLDGTPDIAVGAHFSDIGGQDRGSVYILFLDSSGKVIDENLIADGTGGFSGALDNSDLFGSSLSGLGKFTPCDAYTELAVGVNGDDDGGNGAGAFWIISLDTDGTVEDQYKISELSGGFGTNLGAGDQFAIGLTSPGDIDNNGYRDIIASARHDDDGGSNRGAVYTLFHDNDCGTTHAPSRKSAIEVAQEQKVSIYPNPSNGLMNIELPLETESAEIIVYDVQGKLVYQSGELVNNQSKISLDLSNVLETGMYTVRLRTDGELNTVKMIIN